MRRLPKRGFPPGPVHWNGVVERHRLDEREMGMRAAYNAGLADAMHALGLYSSRGFPMPEPMLQRIRDLEKWVG